jgi:hypothetical protein
MTYEELLADIASKNYRESRTLETPYAALRAVAELHRPEGQEQNDKCWNCQLVYPCPTISAIEQELV